MFTGKLEWAQCIDARWQLVAWVDAEDMAKVLAGLAAVAGRLGIGRPDTSLEVTGELVRGWLESDGERCLVVFDSVTDLASLRRYIPAGGKSRVVMTSSSVLGLGRPVPVGVFTEDEALAFLADRAGLDDAEAHELSREVGRLPLALAQAAAVITAQRLPCDEYMARLRTLPLRDYLIPGDDGAYPHGLAEAILLSMNAAMKSDRTGICGDLLDLVALMSPSGVARDLLRTAGPALWPGAAGMPAIDEALGRLVSASLLSFSGDGSTVTAHRLVMRVARERHARDGTLPALAAAACTVLDVARDSLSDPWRNRAAARDAVSHVIAVNDHLAPALSDDDPQARHLLALRAWALWCLNELSDSATQAIELGQSLLPVSSRLLGQTHPDTLAARNNLAAAYRAAGQLDDAIPLYEQTLADQQRLLGNAHPDTLMSRNGLAIVYRLAGRLDEAILLFEQTLADRARELGEADPDTLMSRNNLAVAYRLAGRLDEAIALYRQVIADRTRVLGNMHRDTLISHNDLAVAYRAAGRLDDAISLCEHALDGLESALGKNHPYTVIVRNNLAVARQLAESSDNQPSEGTLRETRHVTARTRETLPLPAASEFRQPGHRKAWPCSRRAYGDVTLPHECECSGVGDVHRG